MGNPIFNSRRADWPSDPARCGGRDPAYPGTCQFARGHGGPCFDNDDPDVDA